MVLDRVANVLRLPSLRQNLPESAPWQDDPIALYRLLRAYYDGLDLYTTSSQYALERGTWAPAMKALRNPAHRVVEFYTSHLWPDELEIVTTNEAIVEPIQQVWEWSNWGAQSRLAARWFARDGDLFIKVVSRRQEEGAGRVYFQLLDAAHVLDLDRDERGFLTYVHIEVPRVRRERDGQTTEYIHTEIWDRDRGTRRIWERDVSRIVDRLGTPTSETALSEFGIDFIPIVHAQFTDVGNDRGQNAYLHALDKIDEANRMATRLHQMLYRHNNVTWALQANAMDQSGRPIPAPRLEGGPSPSGATSEVTVGDETMYRLPGNATLVPLVPSLNYADALAILNAQMVELEADLPELRLDRMIERDVSGVALTRMMAPAIDRVLEARSNAQQALVRADAMALTMADAAGLRGFSGLGSFEDGDFEHSFTPSDPIGLSEAERWEIEKVKGEAALVAQQSGVSIEQTLRERGYSDQEISEMAEERDAQTQGAFEAALSEFDAGIA